MRLQTRTWFLISVLCFIGAAIFWRLGEQRLANRAGRSPASTSAPPVSLPVAPGAAPAASTGTSADRRGPVFPRGDAEALAERDATARAHAELRLRNTERPLEELIRDDRALLLRNALIDTASGVALPIPEHLRAGEEPGSYIVQSAGPVTAEFRRSLEEVGARFISYLPNNAYLVAADAAQAADLAARPGVQAVLAYEPYYKIEPGLLPLAVEDAQLDPDVRLNLTLLPDSSDDAREQLADLGAEVLSEFSTPFGPGVVVEPRAASLAAISRLPSVQGIERLRPRQLLNDLARERIGVSIGTNAPGSYTNYLGLTGTNVVVNVNDSGVDSTHPDLENRVTADLPSTLVDLEGHGTHVAATIAGSGAASGTVTNAVGSQLNADFRGMAPEAELYALPVDLITGPLISDAYLHQKAATNYYITRGRTNVLISNNSWGYIGAYDYTLSSASYDAAVRDALPTVPGSQPILYVFSAGNSGFGGDDGQGGEPNTIQAPGTGKNVITVGAIETPRQITNEIVYVDEFGELQTNQVFLLQTDSDSQVASFSSRGNIEPGIEGPFGRFKPDVVAPGTFVASARSQDWTDPRSFSSAQVNRITGEEVAPGAINYYPLFVPPLAAEFRIRILPNFRSPDPFPGLPLYLRFGDLPTTSDFVNTNNLIRVPPDDTLMVGDWYYGVGNFTSDTVTYDIQTIVTLTNDFGNYFEELKKLNDTLAPEYRFESGTSMSAPAVSGLLALYLDYFQREQRPASPALLKALLINGARSVSSAYNFSLRDVLNLQGWGLVNLTNALPADDMLSPTGGVHAVQYADVRGADAIQTGDIRRYRVSVDPAASGQILKLTLVWTDPPGNPAAGVKLVNDLDLIVRQPGEEGEEIFYVGNDIPFRSDFNTPRPDLNSVTNDAINNVENVLLRPPLATNYIVEVRGRRVNVNAVTEHPEGIAQDYALVISLEDPTTRNALKVTQDTELVELDVPYLITPTNGLALLSQRVGANPPRFGTAPGVADQWTFFVFTNLQQYTPSFVGITNGSNVAFVTFLPPNLGEPRYRQADIDLYVSTDPQLTNLAPAVIAAADKSTLPGGTEYVVYTNAPLGAVYYIGVKAEDQQAAEFGFVALSSNLPFDEEDDEGNRIVRGVPFNMAIPDGSPDTPQAAYVFGIATRSFEVQRVVVTNTLAFDSTGDILINLSHNDAFSVLSNHALDPTGQGGLFTVIYDDSSGGNVGYGNLIGTPTDGPGRLTDFIGTDAAGPWILSLVDNAVSQTATNVAFHLRLEPSLTDQGFIADVVAANSANFYSVDVPSNATNLTVFIQGIQPDLPLFVGIRRGDLPSFSNYDKGATVDARGAQISLGRRDVPPLNPGRYYIGVFNPNAVPVNYEIAIEIDLDLSISAEQSFGLDNLIPLTDDARTDSVIFVPDDRAIADVRVGIRANHPRVSDLVFRLVSAQGTRLLLAENRGGPDGTAYGADVPSGRIYTTFTDNTNLTSTPIKYGVAPFTNSAVQSSASNRVVLADGFEQAIARTYLAGEPIPNGWRVSSGSAEVVRIPVGSTNIVEGEQYLLLGGGASAVGTNVVLTPGKLYRVRFATGRLPIQREQALLVFINGVNFHEVRREPGVPNWYSDSFIFTAPSRNTLIEFRSPTGGNRAPLALDHVTIEETDRPLNAYYLPEETLKPILGERALGEWRLEVEDTRAGPPGGGLGEVDWRLEFVYALPTIDAIRLTNNVPYFGSVSGTDVVYFYVDTPRCATMSVNTLSGAIATLVLFGDRDGLPVADLGTLQDDYGPYLNIESGGIAQFTLTTNTPAFAPLRPGQRYYLAVRNFQPDLTNNTFGIRVTFDCEDPPLPVVPTITNGIPVRATIDPGPALDYYQFIVSSNAINARITLTPDNGNVDMYIRRARPATGPGTDDYPLPSPSIWDYRADNPDPDATEEISIDRFTPPEPLTPGVWFIAVRNGETFPVTYTLEFNEEYTTIINLTNQVPHTATIPPVDPTIGVMPADLHYYSFLVSSNSVLAHFETYDASGDVNLYVRRGLPIPTPFDFHFAGVEPGAADEFIAVTNTATPIWLTPGWWYLSVENADISEVTYTIRATEFPASITVLTNDVPVTNSIPPGDSLDYYEFTVSPTALSSRFEVYAMSDDVQLLLRHGLPVPTFNDHHYASTNAGLDSEVIELTPFSFPLGLRPGPWYLSVANASSNVASYVIRAVEETAEVTVLTNGVPYNASLEPGESLDYYQFTVSSNAVAAEFLLTSAATGDLDLFIRKGPPLPGPDNFNYQSTNAGVVDEVIRIETNSLPVPLSPGVWYLAVTNKEAVAVSYEIRATEFGLEPPPPTGVVTNITVDENEVCITWMSTPGTNYFVVAKQGILDATWTPVSPTITATDTTTTWCLSPPGPWRFFDVFEGESPVMPIPDLTPELRLDGTNICVSWRSVAGTNYFVQGKQAFTDPEWTTLTPSITATGPTTEVCYPVDWGYRFFRVGVGEVIPEEPTPLPADEVEIDITVDQICLTWNTRSGVQYLVEGKRTIDDPNWTVLTDPITGDGLPHTQCFNSATEFRYFRVIEGVSVPPGPPPNVPVPNVQLSVDAAFQLCLTWDALLGAEYFVEGKVRFSDPTWTVISPILRAVELQVSYCQPLGSVWRYLQVRRVNHPPATPVQISEIVLTDAGPLIRWSAPAGTRFQVFYSASLAGGWQPIGGPVTSLNGDFEFLDDGSEVPFDGVRFYRLEQLP